jgi:hypothetical protein
VEFSGDKRSYDPKDGAMVINKAIEAVREGRQECKARRRI